MYYSPRDIPAPFNPAHRGPPTSLWDSALQNAPVLELSYPAILIVSPHPDDEVLGAGGLIQMAVRAGCDVRVLSVTNGEAAYPDWDGLDAIRRREVSDALQVLAHFKVEPQYLAIPDGRVDQHRGTLFDAIDRSLLCDTLLVAPYEHDGHPDHDSTGAVCCDVAQLRGAPLWRYPIWSWHNKLPRKLRNAPWGRFLLDAAAEKAKAEAISCFTSQIRPFGREPIVPHHVLEYFTRPYESFFV